MAALIGKVVGLFLVKVDLEGTIRRRDGTGVVPLEIASWPSCGTSGYEATVAFVPTHDLPVM